MADTQYPAWNFDKARPYNRMDLILEILKWAWVPVTFVVLSIIYDPVTVLGWTVGIFLYAYIAVGTLADPGWWGRWGILGGLLMIGFLVLIGLFLDD